MVVVLGLGLLAANHKDETVGMEKSALFERTTIQTKQNMKIMNRVDVCDIQFSEKQYEVVRDESINGKNNRKNGRDDENTHDKRPP